MGKVENSGFEIKKDLYLNNIRFDKCEKKLGNCLKNYKLVVHENFLATTYLETISYNFPTVILFREIDSFYLRNEFKKDIKPLIKAKIVHKNFKSLKKFLDENLSNIDEWWNDDKNQKIIKSFIKIH